MNGTYLLVVTRVKMAHYLGLQEEQKLIYDDDNKHHEYFWYTY